MFSSEKKEVKEERTRSNSPSLVANLLCQHNRVRLPQFIAVSLFCSAIKQ